MPHSSRWQELLWRLLPGSLVAAIVGGLQVGGLVYPSEQLSYNWAFQLRGERAWDERVAVVTIDDTSLQKLGRYPWPRQRFTQLMQILAQAEATTVVFDVIFSEPTADDRAFAQAISAHGNVILAQAVDFNGLPLQPVPELSQAALGIGHIYRRTDGDGLTRQIPWAFRGEPSLAAVALQAYGTQHRIPPLPETRQDVWLNWRGSVQRLPRYAFADVLNGQVPPQALKHKIVIVGVGATGFDTLVTPFNRNPSTTGTYLHATAIDNLLNQTDLRPANANGWFLISCGILTPLIGVGFSYLKAKQQLALMGSGLIVWWAAAIVALGSFNIYLPIAMPIGLWVGTAISVAIFERLRMHELLQGELQQLSARYLPSRTGSPIVPNRTPVSLQAANQLTAITRHLSEVQTTQQAITQSLSVGVVAFDRQGNVRFCNATAQQWLHYEPGETLDPILVPHWLTADNWQSIQQQLHRHTSDAQPLPIEREVARQERWYSLNFAAVQTDPADHAPDHAPGYTLLIEDITARKQLETSLNRQVQELQWLAQLKDELLDRISHELRSPITNMLCAIDLLRHSQTPEQAGRYLDRLEQACIQERNFINDLLNLQTAPATAPEQQLWQSLAIEQWLEALIAPFIARTSTRQQTIQTVIDPELAPLYTDPDRLTRIYQELLTNACKYSPAGATIYCTATQQPGYIELSVRNLGTTIAPSELPRIFDKFYRIPQSDPWQQGGTGMGLAIVLRLAEQINATIQARSANDVTEFQLTIPNQSTSPSETTGTMTGTVNGTIASQSPSDNSVLD
jgi:CHASE2 domain-containing sensor protein/signal transduction histidine kinase